MKLSELTSYLETVAPLNYQESYDNSGLIVGHPDTDVTGALTCLDATEDVISEAIDMGINLVIAHHPIVFSGLKKFNGFTYPERAIIKAIKHDVAIYAIHTNLDAVLINGVNSKIAEKLGLIETRILKPKSEAMPSVQVGAGLIGLLPEPMEPLPFLTFLKSQMKVNVVKYTPPTTVKIHKIALCGGSGRFLLDQAIQAGADMFISSDFKYHDYFDANGRIMIADIGHYESEQFTIELINELIIKKFSNFAIHSTKIITNPIKYF